MTFASLPRRGFLAAASLATLPARAPTQPRLPDRPPLGSDVRAFPTVDALAAAVAASDTVAYLAEPGREGHFRLVAGDHRAAVRGDALQGLHIPLLHDRAGASACWIRIWDGARGHPEWWGARVDDPAFDSRPALAACIVHCAETLLGIGAYHIRDTLELTLDNRTISGAGRSDEHARASSSAIVLAGPHAATRDVLRIGHGFDWRPSGPPPQDWTANVRIRDFDVRRTAAPAGAAPGNEAAGPAGVRCLWAIQAQMEGIFAVNHAIGFYWGASVYCRHAWLEAFRDRPGADGNDFFVGFFIDGNFMLGSTYAGGNASLYFNQVKAGVTVAPRNRSNGFFLAGGFADTFMTDVETYGSPKRAMVIAGSADHPVTDVRRAANGDLHLTRLVLDNAGEVVLDIGGLSAYATVDITDPYLAVAGSADQSILYLHDGGGQITITGGEALGWPNAHAGGAGYGLLIARQTGVSVRGLKLVGCVRPVVLDAARAFDLEPGINNPGEASPHPAIELVNGTSRGRIVPVIFAAADRSAKSAAAFRAGVALDRSVAHVEINASGIDPACLGGPKVASGGTPLRAAGPFGADCLLTGIAT